MLRMPEGRLRHVDVGAIINHLWEGKALPGWEEGSQTINIEACKKEGHVQDPHIFFMGKSHWRKA